MKPREITKILEQHGFTWRLLSPNNPKNPRQWYKCKIGKENPKDWRIDAERGCLELTCFDTGTFNTSWRLDLSEIGDKHGIELCDEYSISIDFWGHGEHFERIPITEIERVFKKEKEWQKRAIGFLKECIHHVQRRGRAR